MSGPTKPELEAKIDELQKTLSALVTSERDAHAERKRAQDAEATASILAGHFRAQRDTLIGYVEGTRLDRDEKEQVATDQNGIVHKIPNRTDEFLATMRRDPPSNTDTIRRY